MQKYEIVNALIASNGYRRYLEICTPTTGGRFSRIRGASLDWRHRLMYRCPPGFQDGSEITFRSSNERISHLLDPRMPYDVIFIDPYHSFECSLRDLQSALAMLRPEGAVVIHDCCPIARETSGPSFRPGSWFGLTYCAYIEFVLSRPDLVHYTRRYRLRLRSYQKGISPPGCSLRRGAHQPRPPLAYREKPPARYV